jgi:hypothetical protein
MVNEQNVREAINSFPAGSSPGLDGLRPQYLKYIISLSAGEAGQQALRAFSLYHTVIRIYQYSMLD